MTEKLGGEEQYKEWVKENAKKGGSAKVPKGFAVMPPKKRSKIAKQGGKAKARVDKQ